MKTKNKKVFEIILNALVVLVGVYFLACWLNIVNNNLDKHPNYAAWNIMAKEISHDKAVQTKSVKATVTSVDLDTETVYVSYNGNLYGYKANGEVPCGKVTVVFNASMEIIDVR